MVNPKRKSQYDVDGRDVKKFRQSPPSAYRQSHDGKHQNKRGGRAMTQQPHTREQISEQLHQVPRHLVAQTMQQIQQKQQMLGSLQQHGLPQRAQQQQSEELKVEKQEHKPVSFVPYSALKIPILSSTNIDHSFNLTLENEQWDSTAWKHYYCAIAMIKTGIGREQLGLPTAKEGHGSPVTIDYVDLYLDLSDGKVYVAASERGLVTVLEYLKLSDIAVERKLRFTGRTPAWAKAVFDAAETRYVTETFQDIPLPVRSEVQVLNVLSLPLAPASLWGSMYSAYLKQVIQFPLEYTTKDREFAMVKGRPGPLSAAELKHVLALPEKDPSPQELGEALFKQAQECDRNTLDLQMTKSRDDYLKECGYMYGKTGNERIVFGGVDSEQCVIR
ncbi:hypothetical protein P171DRAFT_440424 [Karstenula rhodostoma CBS 690.94]|uniref:Uncharacterized protein n=1 Tax=Karstenula rhodostoma CBS 690.94 TaxID=1392251 RepID=A0A9P4UI73_9PLEO|nr:hypothetical protein P171DRAFT_440424 [Karstenula rhodostoma CBS 690.94]